MRWEGYNPWRQPCLHRGSAFWRTLPPMSRLSKLRLREVPGWSKSGGSASESGAPLSPWYLLGAWVEWKLCLGSRRVHLRWVPQAGGGLAPHRELVHLLGQGEEEAKGQWDRRDTRRAGHAPPLPIPCSSTYAGSVAGQGAQAQHAWGGHASRAMKQWAWGGSHREVSHPSQGTCKREAERCRWAGGTAAAGTSREQSCATLLGPGT